MRIAIFINTYLPVHNGVTISTSLLKRGLENLGHTVEIFTVDYPGSEPEEGVRRYPGIKLPRVDFAFPLKFHFSKSEIESFREFDLIHLQHPFLLGELGLKLAKKLNLPVSFTFHTQYENYVHYFPLLPTSMKRAWVRRKLTKFLNQVDAVIVPSKKFIEYVKTYSLPEAKLHHLPNPVDLSRFSPPASDSERSELRKKYGLPDREFIVAFVGRLAKEKNLTELLEVFREVLKMCNSCNDSPSPRLVFVGCGEQEEELKLRIKADELLRGKVIFLGLIRYEFMPQIYRCIDLLVSTSFTEVKPLAYLEAMASGVPIVAYMAPGADDTIISGVNGFLIEPQRELMARTVVRIIREPELYKKLSTGAYRTSQEYSLERVSKLYEELFMRLRGSLEAGRGKR